MPSCRNCGNELAEDAQYCSKCGTPIEKASQPRLAFWSERFLAWLVDVVILGIVIASISLLAWVWWPGFAKMPRLSSWFSFVNFGFSNVVHFLYWAVMEGVYGRSFGKMLMRIRVARLDGQPVDILQAALESVGKAFLLPLDLILGWFLHRRKRQRIFNYLSGTIVLKA